MTRIFDFIDFEEKSFDHVEQLLTNQGKTADVYRRTYDENSGISEEVGALTRIKRITVFVTVPKKSFSSENSGAMAYERKQLLALTNDREINRGDVLRIAGVDYSVQTKDDTFENCLHLYLEQL